MGSFETLNTQCFCDPIFASLTYNVSASDPKCSTYTKACFGEHIIFVILFFGMFVYGFLSFSATMKFTIKRRKEHSKKGSMQTRISVLVLGTSFCFVRWIRYLVLVASSEENVLSDYATFIFLDVFYTGGVVLGLGAYAFLIYAWMEFYHKIVKRQAKYNELNERTSSCSPAVLGKSYLILTILGISGYTIAFSLEIVLKASTGHSISAFWLVLTLICIVSFFIVYGRRISKTLSGFNAKLESDVKRFHKLNWMTKVAGIFFVVLVVILIIGTVLNEVDNSIILHLIKHAVYRFLELILIFVILKSLSPGVATILNQKSDFSLTVDASLEMKKKSGENISKENTSKENISSENISKDNNSNEQ